MSRHRESTTPMDFEWADRNGPIDEASPFITAARQRQDAQAAKKRPASVLDSPSKSFGGFHTPNRPHLREAHTQPFYFSENSKPLPAVPSHVSKAWEPRTPTSVVDFSSGGETPNTPAHNDESDAGTPDTQMASQMGRLMADGGGRTKSPKKASRRQSWFKNIFSSSPSPTREKYYSKKDENRVTKRRSKRREMTLRDEHNSEDEGPTKTPVGASSQQQKWEQGGYVTNAANFFGWIEAHPNLPEVLTYYVQFALNTGLGFLFLYVVYLFYSAIVADINIESRKYIDEAMLSIMECSKHYRENRCEPNTRVPAMQAACREWEKCMKQDPKAVAKGSVGARAFATIFNSFVETLSYKSMVFTAIVLFGGFNLSNWAFGFIRSKQHQHPPAPHDAFFPPPATPHRQASGGFIDQQGYYTPFHTPYATMKHNMVLQASQSMPALPAPSEDSGAGMQQEKERSPRKRLFR